MGSTPLDRIRKIGIWGYGLAYLFERVDKMSTPVIPITQVTESDALAELIELLEQVDLTSQIATLNETTISDNNGSRIEL